MNIEQSIRKSLDKIKSDEKGWRKALDGSEGSYSKEFAQENLRRLDSLRRTLLNQLASNERRRKQVMRLAISEGIFTDHNSDGVCEQLLGEGWLERAAPMPPRRHTLFAPVYLPTEKAIQDWNAVVTE
jgi:hypothetical protein